jgi:hypothetical protein
MNIDKDINFNMNPGDVGGLFPGSYNVIPVEPHELTADEYKAQLRNYELILVLMNRLASDGVDENYIIKAYQLVRDNHTSQKGKRRVPSDKGRELIITLYDTISQYRDDVVQTRDFGPYPSEAVYDLRCAMLDIIKMYDEYCAAIRDLIVPPMPQQTLSPLVPDATMTDAPTDLFPGNDVESVDTHMTAVQEKSKGRKKVEAHVNSDELSSYFNAIFKGLHGNPDFFSQLVAEIEKLTTPTDLGRVAYMIYNCNKYVVKRHSVFSEWMREFFKIVGVRCPKDVRENKYQPNRTFQNRFYFLPYNDQAHD